MFDNIKYIIFNTTELGSIDFTQVFEESADTVRLSLNGSKTFVKYEGSMPSSISSLTTKSQEYTHEEILTILDGNEWIDNSEVLDD